ncbi:MAG: hypothetical protein ABSE08_20590 [Syntrophobacteraceae bacterium]|jgi:hypothetical protein
MEKVVLALQTGIEQTSYELLEMIECFENAQIGLIDLSLARSIGKSYDFSCFGGATEVFRAKIRSQNAVWMHSTGLDTLFRFTAHC